MSLDAPREPLSQLARRLWKTFGVMALLVVTFLVVNGFLPKDQSLRGGDLGHDFLAFYTAGTFAGQGEYTRMYDMEAVRDFQFGVARQIGLALGPGFMPWWNPPFAALAVEPLAKLPYRTALTVWLAINATAVAVACTMLIGMLRNNAHGMGYQSMPSLQPNKYGLAAHASVDWRIWMLVPALVFLSMPFLLSMTHGQNTGISLMLLTGVVVLWQAKRAFLAGVVCGLMFYKPQLGALVALALTIRLGWRAAAGVASTGIVLTLTTLLAMPGALQAFLFKMPANLTWFQEANQYYWERHVTFKALWRLLIQHHDRGPTATSVVVLWAICAAVLGVALLTILVRRPRSVETGSSEDRVIAATVACSPLLMPFYFDYDLLLMAVPVVLYAADRLRSSQLRTSDRWTVAAWATLAGYMILHPHIADATNVNGNVIVMTWCAAMTVARAWRADTRIQTTSTSAEPEMPHRIAAYSARPITARLGCVARISIAPVDKTPMTSTPTPLRKKLWKMGVGVLLFVATAAIVNAFLPADKRLGAGSFGNDLMPSYAAGKLIADGRGDELYNPYAVSRIVHDVWATSYPQEAAKRGMAPWLNPPFYALLFVPLAAMSYPAALSVWIGINAVLLIAACGLLIKLLPDGAPWSVKGLVPLLVVTSFPFVQATSHQQNTFLSLAILSSALVMTQRALPCRTGILARLSPRLSYAPYAAGAIAGLLFFKPQLGLIVSLSLGFVLGYRALIGAFATGTLLLALGELALPGATWSFLLEMPTAIAQVQERSGYKWSRQMTLLSFWQILLHGELGGAVTTVVKSLYAVSAAAVVGALAWSARKVWQTANSVVARRWLAAAICAMPLVMPYYMDYDLLLLAGAAVLLASDVMATNEPADRRIAWSWIALAAWLLFQPPMAASWRVHVTVVMLTMITAMMIRRVNRPANALAITDVRDDEPQRVRLAA